MRLQTDFHTSVRLKKTTESYNAVAEFHGQYIVQKRLQAQRHEKTKPTYREKLVFDQLLRAPNAVEEEKAQEVFETTVAAVEVASGLMRGHPGDVSTTSHRHQHQTLHETPHRSTTRC